MIASERDRSHATGIQIWFTCQAQHCFHWVGFTIVSPSLHYHDIFDINSQMQTILLTCAWCIQFLALNNIYLFTYVRNVLNWFNTKCKWAHILACRIFWAVGQVSSHILEADYVYKLFSCSARQHDALPWEPEISRSLSRSRWDDGAVSQPPDNWNAIVWDSLSYFIWYYVNFECFKCVWSSPFPCVQNTEIPLVRSMTLCMYIFPVISCIRVYFSPLF